jgi:hypothetical protein
VRGEDDGHPAVPELAHPVPHEQPGLRVEAGARLVEEDHPGRVHQRPGDQQPLRHAAGVVVDLVAAAVAQTQLRQQGVGPPVPFRPPDPVVRGVEDQVLPGGERPVEVGTLGHDRQPTACGDRVGSDVDPRDAGATRRRQHPRGEHPDGRGLARAVGPQQAEDLAALDGEGDAVDRVRGSTGIALDECVDLHGGVHRRPSLHLGRRRIRTSACGPSR